MKEERSRRPEGGNATGESMNAKSLHIPPKEMARGADKASSFLKTLSHETRLRILCLLLDGEKSVGEIARRLGMRQAAVSQQLQRLRAENLVQPRRQGKEIYYQIASLEVLVFMEVLHEIFCPTDLS